MTLKRVREQLFELRARVVGVLSWTCPDCGHLNRMTLAPRFRWLVRCKNQRKGWESSRESRAYWECGASFRIGLVFYRQPPGNGGRPKDVVMGQAFPEAELSPRPYKGKMAVHQVREGPEGG